MNTDKKHMAVEDLLKKVSELLGLLRPLTGFECVTVKSVWIEDFDEHETYEGLVLGLHDEEPWHSPITLDHVAIRKHFGCDVPDLMDEILCYGAIYIDP